jgi:DNA helicase-2/ATP-dependent DNA helicase PcrA
MSDDYLASLNPEQLEAVRHEGGPLLILAGAGSGKTRVITTKIAWLVRERGVAPESILAVTFTNKAAKEMRDRAAAIEPRCERAVIRTFHSFGAWFLRRNAGATGLEYLDRNFVIYDDDDQTTLLHGAFPQYSRSECSRMVQAISRAKDFGYEPDSPALGKIFADPALRRVYAEYETRLRATRNVDFGDLIRLPAKILREDGALRRRTRQRFRVILVDEYQDSNVAQFELLSLLAGGAPDSGGADPGLEPAYLCVVGDDDQSIYRFRGAEVKNILSFPDRFPGTKIVRLERNYRSYQSILDVAGDVVSHNSGRLGKELRAERQGGRKPKIALLEDQDEEVAWCARTCLAKRKEGRRWGELAILYRTNAQSLGFEKEFPRRGIPYHIVGALRFYEREEVKDILAYLAVVLNGHDEVAFKRVVNKPTRGVGDTSVEAIVSAASLSYAGDLIAASEAEADSLRGRAKTGLRDFVALVREFRGVLGVAGREAHGSDNLAEDAEGDSGAARRESQDRTDLAGIARSDSRAGKAKGLADGEGDLGELVESIAKRSGLLEYHRGQDEVAGTQKAANIDELVNAAALYPRSPEGLAEFLETIELDRTMTSETAEADAVTLITMHNTKGLEFPVVMVTGLEQGLFPRDDDQDDELEEQRRLFYVAITRAKDELFLTACRYRRLHGRIYETLPSRFLSEVGQGRLDFEDGARRPPRPSDEGYNYDGYRSRGGYPSGGKAADAARAAGHGQAAGRPRGGEAPGEKERIWRAGQAVYHEDYGSGVIIMVKPTPSSGPLVVVRFETGKQAQFFPKFSTKLEMVKA